MLWCGVVDGVVLCILYFDVDLYCVLFGDDLVECVLFEMFE